MGCSGISCSHNPRPSHVTHPGKLPENRDSVGFSIASRLNEAWDVLKEEDAGSYSSNAASNERPEVALVIFAKSLPGCREWLAGEASNDAIHRSTPCSPVEGSEVVIDGGSVQPPVLHPTEENFLSVRVLLDITGSPPAERFGHQVQPTDA